MSADNGIYIGRFRDEEGVYSYRVAHAQAIENCDKDKEEFREWLKKLEVVKTIVANDRTLLTASSASYIFDNFEKLKSNFIESKMSEE